jgi:BolA protein
MPHRNPPAQLSAEDLRTQLAAACPGASITLRDDTHKHLAHNAMVGHDGGHFWVQIVWEGFAGWPRLRRHRHVWQAVAEAWAAGQIHALSLRLETPAEHA